MPTSCSWVRAVAVITVAGIALGAAAPAQAAGDANRGKQIAYTCLGCHGIENYKNVYPTYDVPKLAGQHPEYLVAALKGYKSRERAHGTMFSQAGSLSDQDIEDVAAYLSGTAITKGATPVGKAPEKVAQLCQACHGADGVGITADYPTLSGQHVDYLERALLDYKLGRRKNAVMGTFVTQLSEADIKAIAEYYAQQKPSLATVPRRLTLFSAK
ncbi:MAG: cytochrome c [Steroidobacteraceae bacterium]